MAANSALPSVELSAALMAEQMAANEVHAKAGWTVANSVDRKAEQTVAS